MQPCRYVRQMRTAAWITIIVATTLATGLSAFLLATPDQGRRIRPDDLGFHGLTRAAVDGAAANAAVFHESRYRGTVTTRSATANARAWLIALAGSGSGSIAGGAMPRRVTVAPTGSADARRVGAFVRWADDLPPSAWKVTIRATTPQAATNVDAYAVTAFVDVSVAQAVTYVRRQRLAVSMQLVGVGGTATSAPRSWQVRDVAVRGPSTFVRGYLDPIVVRRDSVDIVAPSTSTAVATAIAEHAQEAMSMLRARYASLDGPERATVWMLEEGASAPARLGTTVPKVTVGAARGTPHGFSWVDDRGEVVVDLARAGQVSPALLRAAVTHELTILALRELRGTAPDVLLEGAAGWEVRRTVAGSGSGATAAQGQVVADLALLEASFARRDVHLGALLAAAPGGTLAAEASPALRRTAHLAGAATVGWIETRYGHARLVRLLEQLRDDVPVARALHDVLRLDVATLQRGVEIWTTRQVRPIPSVADPEIATGAGTIIPTDDTRETA